MSGSTPKQIHNHYYYPNSNADQRISKFSPQNGGSHPRIPQMQISQEMKGSLERQGRVVEHHYHTIQYRIDPQTTRILEHYRKQIDVLTGMVGDLQKSYTEALLKSKRLQEMLKYEEFKQEVYKPLAIMNRLQYTEPIKKISGHKHHVIIGSIATGKGSLINYACGIDLEVGMGQWDRGCIEVAVSESILFIIKFVFIVSKCYKFDVKILIAREEPKRWRNVEASSFSFIIKRSFNIHVGILNGYYLKFGSLSQSKFIFLKETHHDCEYSCMNSTE